MFKEIGSQVYEKRTANLLGISKEEETSQERLLDRSRLSSIISVSQHISSILNLNELLEEIMDKVIQVTGAQRGYLLIANERTGELEVRAARNIAHDEISSEGFQFSRGIVDEVYRSGEKVITTDAQSEDDYAKFQSVISYGLKSILCVSIKHGEKIMGVCYLDNPLSSSVFTEDDADLLSVFVSQAAISIENAHAYETITRRVNELSSLHNIGTAITSILDMDGLLDTVLKTVVHDLGYDRAMIMLVDEARDVLSRGRGIGGTEEMVKFIEQLELPISEDGGVLSQIVISGNPILVSDVKDTEIKMDMDIITTLKTRSFLAVPLKTKEKVIGIMAADNVKSEMKLAESDERLLSTLAGQVAISIENARLVEEVASRERMKQELELAYNIQVGLLPQMDPEIPGFEIVGGSIPAEEVGGDFYNYYQIDDNKLCIAIGDVSGKGISAAMFMAVTSGMIDSEAKKSSSASELIESVNNLLIPRAKPSRMNSALLYAILDSEEKRLRVANAGMIAPLVCRGDGSECDYMDVKGFPAGMTTIGSYEEREVKLQRDDIVVLSSDGIVEAMNDKGEMFGFDGLQHTVYQNRELSAHNLLENILRELRSFVLSEVPQDDITMVILKVL